MFHYLHLTFSKDNTFLNIHKISRFDFPRTMLRKNKKYPSLIIIITILSTSLSKSELSKEMFNTLDYFPWKKDNSCS